MVFKNFGRVQIIKDSDHLEAYKIIHVFVLIMFDRGKR